MTFIKKYAAIFRVQVLHDLAYPADLFSRSLSILVFMWVFFHLWRTAYGAVGQERIAGLSLRDTLWYLVIAETVVLSQARVSRRIAADVKEGAIAYLLNRPYDFLLYLVTTNMADTLSRMVLNLLAGGGIVWLLLGPPPSMLGIPLALLAMLFAWLLDFSMNAIIGLAAFVFEDVAAFDWIYSKFVILLGGVLIPLDFFPAWLRDISLSLPFAYTAYGPARIFVDPSLATFGGILLRQLGWLAALWGVLLLVYRQGLKRLAVNGG